MAGGQYLDPHPRGEICDEHTENIAIICQQEADCFGEPVLKIIDRACKKVSDYGDSIDSRNTKNGFQLFERSINGSSSESRDAQCQLLAHSLWIVDPETLIEDGLASNIRFQLVALPSQASVFTWVNKQKSNRDKICRDIESRHLGVRVADSAEEFESWVTGYLDFGVNPNTGEETAIEWSNEAADKIDNIIQ